MFKWKEGCNKTFDILKMLLSVVFKCSEFDKKFEIHTDVCDFTIGGDLM